MTRRFRIGDGNAGTSHSVVGLPLAFLVILGTLFTVCFSPFTGGHKGPYGNAHASTLVKLPGHVPGLIKKSQLLGPTDPNTPVSLLVGLHLRNAANLQAYVDSLSRSHSVTGRHYLTPAQIASAYGPLPTSQSALLAYMQQNGFKVTMTFKHHLLIGFQGTVGQAEQAFHVQINNYRSPKGRMFYAPATDPGVPTSVADIIQSVTGLDNAYQLTHPANLSTRATARVRPYPTTVGSPMNWPQANELALYNCIQPEPGPTYNYYTPGQIATAYNLTGLYSAGFQGEGQSMAVYELDDYVAGDIKAYTSCFGGSSVPINRVLVNGGTGGAPGSGASEVELDMELVLSAAPHLATLSVYEAPNTFSGALAEWGQIVSDAVPVVSTSWGVCEANTTTAYVSQENSLFMVAAAQGQSIFAAAGDSGSNDCGTSNPTSPSVDDPASQPYVTGVGGTSLVLTAGNYGSETAWNNASGAGGGGISTLWQMPTWQQSPGVPDGTYSSGTPCGASIGKYCREVPDVSLHADPTIGYPVYCTVSAASPFCSSSSPWNFIAGTSAAAPMWAAMTALANQKSLHDGYFNLGFLNSFLYQVAQSASSTSYANDFHDVTSGTNDKIGNGDYPTTPNYDMATGLGSYNGLSLATDLELLAKNVTNARSSPASSTWYFAEGSVGNSFHEFITLLNPSPNQAATVNITYLFENKPSTTIMHMVSPSTRYTVDVNTDLGVAIDAPQEAISAIVHSTPVPIVAERPMYFDLHGIASGTDAVGATNATNTTFYFAEGDSRQGSSTYYTYITILNPSQTSTAHAHITYYSHGSVVGTENVNVGPMQRGTGTPVAVGLHQQVAIKVTSDIGVVVERPMYFKDNIPTAGGWTTGAASAVGATSLGANTGSDWLFAEGYTGNGTNFQEYLVLANFTNTNASVNVKLEYANGTVQTVPVIVAALSQYYFDVNNAYNHPLAACGCTPTPEVSAEVYATTPSIVAERLMYFHFGSSHISGETDVVGEAGPASHVVYTFAEGYTYGSFSEYLTLQNPTNTTETVAITLFADNTIVQEMRQLAPHSRTTVSINSLIVPMANAYPANPFVHGFEVSMDVQVINGSSAVVAERPMYFVLHGDPGGTDVLGYTGG